MAAAVGRENRRQARSRGRSVTVTHRSLCCVAVLCARCSAAAGPPPPPPPQTATSIRLMQPLKGSSGGVDTRKFATQLKHQFDVRPHRQLAARARCNTSNCSHYQHQLTPHAPAEHMPCNPELCSGHSTPQSTCQPGGCTAFTVAHCACPLVPPRRLRL